MFGRAIGFVAVAALFAELSMGVATAVPAQSSSAQSATAAVSAAQARVAAAKRKPAVIVQPVSSAAARITILPALGGTKTWRFTVQKAKTVTKTVTKNKRRYKVKVTKWSSYLTTRTGVPTSTRVVALDKGRYRVYVPAQNKYAATISPSFSAPMTMPAPTPSPTVTPTTPAPIPPTQTTPAPITPTSATPSPTTPTAGTPTPTTPTATPTTSTPSGSESPSGPTSPPAKVPTPPQSLNAISGNGSILVFWFVPFSDGGSPITGYTAYADGKQCSAAASENSCVIENLVNGMEYRVTAVAKNAAGDSAPATVNRMVVPSKVPSAPTAVSGVAQRDGTSVAVSWTPGDTGGLPIIKYRADADPGNAYCETTDNKCVLTGLAMGTAYKLTVVATNARGTSAASDASSPVVPAAPPGAPFGLAVAKGAGQARVSWNVASNGSTVVKSVVVATPATGSPLSMTVTGNPAPTNLVFTGLTNGTSYTFKVTSTNAMGWEGPASAASPAVTPLTVPTAPAGMSVAVGSKPGQAAIAWSDSYNGGAPITTYEVYSNLANRGLVCRMVSANASTQAARSCTVYLLAAGVPVQFRVRAYNVEGWSDWSPWSPSVSPS